jgi:hypothetical protein
MLGFRWKKHTTTTYLGSGGKNTQAKTCLGSGGKNTQLQHTWVQVGKTHNYNMLGFRWEKHTS